MKRVLGIICIIAMLMAYIPSLGVFAVETAPLFSFDASVYEGIPYEQTTGNTKVTIKQGVQSNGNPSGTITKETFTNGKGEEVSYLVIKDTTNINGGIDNVNKVSLVSDDFGGNMTAEMWVQYTAVGWRNFIGILPYDENGNKISSQLIDLKTNNATQLLFCGAGDTSTLPSTAQNDKWLHLVISKEYNSNYTKATSKFYCNGILLNSVTKNVTNYVEEKGAEIYFCAPTIDQSLTSGNTWIIDKCAVSRVNVYDGVLDDTAVQNLFKEQRYDFSEEAPDAPSYTGTLAEVDYNTYPEGSYTYTQLQDLAENIIYGSKGIYSIESTIAGNTLKAQSQNASGYREASTRLNLSQPMTYGRIVTDVTFKVYGSGLFRYPYRIAGQLADGTAKTITTIRYDSGFKADDGSGRGITSPKLDGYGFYQLSFVLTAKDATSDWKLSMYDRMGDCSTPIYTQDIKRANLDKVVAVTTGGTYCNTDAQEEQSINILNANVTATAIGAVSEVSEYDTAENSVKVKFNTPIGQVPDKVFAESLSGKLAMADVTKGNDDTELVFTFPTGLPEDSDYTIILDKIPYKDSILLFSSEFTFTGNKNDVSLYNISMTDEKGNSVTNLDGINQLNVSYNYSSDIEAYLFAATHSKDGQLLSVAHKPLNIGSGSGSFAFDLANAEDVNIYIWDKAGMQPIYKNTTIGYSPDGERVEIPLSITGGFYNGDNQSISYIKGQDEIIAKARLTATTPPENMLAVLSAVRGNETINENTADITFSEGSANVDVSLTDYTAESGDALVFTIKDNSKVYYTKTLRYEDLSKTVDILLIAGQSNAEGHMGNAEESIKPDLNTVYLNTMGNTTLTTQGIKGWAGSLGKTWHERTGHTVIVVRAAAGGTGFADGNWTHSDTAEGSKYANAKALYRAAVASVKAKSGYEIGDCVYFWLQGENEQSSWNAEQYKEEFLNLHQGFINDFGTSDDDKLTHCGILPIRAGKTYFPTNLQAIGVRAAHYDIAAENEDISMVSSFTEYLNSDKAVMEWFENKYKNLHYPTGDIPLVMYNVFMDDNVHYAQKGYNELGYEAADNMLDYMGDTKDATGVSILSPDGIKNYSDGDDIILPKTDSIVTIYPTASAKTVEYTLSDNIAASLSEYGVLTPNKAFANSYSTLTVKADGKEMTFKVYSSLLDDSISIAAVKDNKKAVYTFITDDGYWDSTNFYQDEFKKLGMTGTVAFIPSQIEEGKANRATWAEWKELLSEGIFTAANHTMNHITNTYINNMTGLTDELLETEINESRKLILEKLPGQKVLGLVLPGNWAPSVIVNKAKEQHMSIRSGSGNTTLPIDDEDDLYALHFQTLQDETLVSTMNGWVDTAISKGQWVVEMWHGVREGEDTNPNSQGYAPSKADASSHFTYVAGLKDNLWIANWDQGICYTIERLHAKVSMLSQTTTELKLEVKDDLDDNIYDEALTVNINCPAGWEDVVATQNENTLKASVKNGIISVNIVPDSGVVTITKK